jgi:phosphoribosyl 1,2-cyclic phosphodiesterase
MTADAAAAGVPLTVRFWGTRGSIPAPGPGTVRVGGNTSCLEVRHGSRLLVLDAGTGIRALGIALAEENATVDADLVLSHYHWDHVQGLPFFPPLYDARTRLRIWGPGDSPDDVRRGAFSTLDPLHFPVRAETVAADVRFEPLRPEARASGPSGGGMQVRWLEVRHPQRTLGFRVDAGGRSLAYVPDNELAGGQHPVPAGWYDRFVEFVGGVDLLVHDAMYTDAEHARCEGWGHSTHAQAVELAHRAGARHLSFFHHHPERRDEQLDEILADRRASLDRNGSALTVSLASEGLELRP